MHPEDLPDRVHIEALRLALWRPESRAAVMVGAGMSRNAEKLSPAVPDFPVWWQIAAELQKAVDPKAVEHDALRLGQMYENTYGRTRLDDLLIEFIPDGKYEPGPLHERLMLLPWADVFTTNYDTLLERTRSRVPERQYDVVEIPADLTRAERPRIVKLHGSFPSRRPFILTAEDYRRYPINFAPFVNLVRQSAMENVLCLVGFSGDDPNFLQWAGWVRDQLGSTAPKVYLCGVLDLTTPKRSYYQHMQVIPVDLGPLFPGRDWATSERHRVALAWLLESLHAGEPVDRSKWPHIRAPARTKPLPAPSPLPLPPPKLPEILGEPRLEDDGLDRKTLDQLLASWRSERECYPGWVVCPEPARSSLASSIPGWFWRFSQPAGVQILEELPLIARADALREIAWQAETGLYPLPETLPPLIEKTLESINPRPLQIDLRDATLTHHTTTEQLNWDHLTEVWVALAFALVRYAWQFQEFALHERWMERLQRVTDARPEWRARWHHEKCWHHLTRLEGNEALQAVRQWPTDLSLPFWAAKRAAVLGELGELGELDEARSITARALERIQLGRDRMRPDYRSMSEEGWVHILDSHTRHYSLLENEQRQRRLREFTREHCNPWDDLRDREQSAQRKNGGGRHEKQTRGFDPGTVTRSLSWSPWSGSEWVLICTLHDGAMPLLKSDGLLAALRRLWRMSPFLALGLALRAVASDALEEGNALAGLVGRPAIARFAQADVDRLYGWLTAVLQGSLAEREQHRAHRGGSAEGDLRRIRGAAEVLSRIAFRLVDAQLSGLFDLACSMYMSPTCQRSLTLHRPIGRLLLRTIAAAPPALLGSWLPRLTALPVAGEPELNIVRDAFWPDPFEKLSWKDLPPLTPSDMAASSPAVNRLLGLVREGAPETRRRASVRLADLVVANVLTPGQLQSMLGAIWNKTNNEGYPADIGFQPWVLLKLPERQRGEARRVVARYLSEADLELEDWLDQLSTTTAWPPERLDGDHTWAGITWTPEEARALLMKLLSAWQSPDRDIWLARDPELPRRVSHVLSTAIVPFLNYTEVDTSEQVRKLVDDIAQRGGSIVCAWLALVLFGAATPATAATEVYRALLGIQQDRVQDGVASLVAWIDLHHAERIIPPPGWLVDALIACAETSRHPGLTHVLDGVTELVSRKRSILEARHLEALERGLDRIRESMGLESMQDDGTWDDDLPLDADERMAILAEASALAAALAVLYRHRGAEEPAAVATWRAFAGTHPLPEVRRPWRSPLRTLPHGAPATAGAASTENSPSQSSGEPGSS